MTLTRRQTASLAALMFVAACTGTTASQLVIDIQTIDAGLATLPALLAAAGVKVSAAVQAQINTALTDIDNQAQSIAAALTTPGVSAQAVVADIKLIAALVTPFFPQAATIVPLVEAAVSLIGTLLSLAGVTGAAPAPPAKYSPDAARVILRAAAAKR